MDLDAIKGVGPATRTKLNEAGITDVTSLANADPAALSEATGISVDRVRNFVTQAQGHAAGETAGNEDAPDGTLPAGVVAETPEPVATAAEQEAAREAAVKPPNRGWKVVLRDRAATARLDAGDVTYENLPIVTAKAGESADEIMKEVGYNAVLLAEGEQNAAVRLNGEWKTGLPLYKEKALDGSGATELVRVRVHEIRERGRNGSKAGAGGKVAGSGKEERAGGLLGLFKKKA